MKHTAKGLDQLTFNTGNRILSKSILFKSARYKKQVINVAKTTE